jgi:hypothetical protein
MENPEQRYGVYVYEHSIDVLDRKAVVQEDVSEPLPIFHEGVMARFFMNGPSFAIQSPISGFKDVAKKKAFYLCSILNMAEERETSAGNTKGLDIEMLRKPAGLSLNGGVSMEEKERYRVSMRMAESLIAKEEYTRIGQKTIICCLTLKNGFEVIGQGSCIHPGNFSWELGKNAARNKALDKVLLLVGYLLQEELFIKGKREG